MSKYWLSGPPQQCDGCDTAIKQAFYDMASVHGPWGIFCPSCAIFGPGCGRTGPGYGQKYELQSDKRYLKTEG